VRAGVGWTRWGTEHSTAEQSQGWPLCVCMHCMLSMALNTRARTADMLGACCVCCCSFGTSGSHNSSSSGPSWPSLGSWSPVEAGPAQAAALPADAITTTSSSGQQQQQQFADSAPPMAGSSAVMSAQSSSSDPTAAVAAGDPGARGVPLSRGRPLAQTPISAWMGPPPAQLQLVRRELQHLVTSLSYQTAPLLGVKTTFKNFG